MGWGLLSLQNTRGIPDSMQKLPLLFLHSHECLFHHINETVSGMF